jgi:hypothetical protein
MAGLIMKNFSNEFKARISAAVEECRNQSMDSRLPVCQFVPGDVFGQGVAVALDGRRISAFSQAGDDVTIDVRDLLAGGTQ